MLLQAVRAWCRLCEHGVIRGRAYRCIGPQFGGPQTKARRSARAVCLHM